MATCLSIVQSVCKRVGLSSVSSAYSNSDAKIQQIVELCNESGQEVARRYPWQVLINEGTFTTVATEIQGAMSTIAPACDYIINDTIWNRSLRRPVFGPKVSQQWQQSKAFALNGPWSSYRIQGDSLRMYPVPTAGESCYFEYLTKNWITKSVGGSASEWTNDADVPLLDDQMLILDTIWRWKAAKGLEYAEDFAKAERRIQDLMTRDAGKDWLNTTNTKYDVFPGVVVPSGSWSL